LLVVIYFNYGFTYKTAVFQKLVLCELCTWDISCSICRSINTVITVV